MYTSKIDLRLEIDINGTYSLVALTHSLQYYIDTHILSIKSTLPLYSVEQLEIITYVVSPFTTPLSIEIIPYTVYTSRCTCVFRVVQMGYCIQYIRYIV